ncbi:uncharacterized protein [Nicotiana sylvestris]|uniref:uncharacterized protein n=1 Tax=Nicotiana sylvestris TaxID=4096 RepID=UPI00388CD405
MKKASEAPVRSWKDQKIIANLMEKMQDYDSILTKTEKALGKAKGKIIQLNEEAKSNKERQVIRFEEDMAQFKKEKDRWIHSEAQLHAQLEEMRRSKGPIPEIMSIPDVDTSVEIEELDVNKMKEEMLKLKQQMAEMYRAWSTGQSPPAYPANPASTPPPAQTQDHPATDLSPSFRPSQTLKGERLQKKKTFTPLGESYTSLFHGLKQLDMLRPIQSKLPNPPPKNLDYTVSCEYCSGTPGHDIEKCWHLKNAIHELIDTNKIEVQAPEAPNINRNLMPAHQEANMIEIVHTEGETKKPSQTVMMIRSNEAKTDEQLADEKSVLKQSKNSVEPSVAIEKGSSSKVATKQEGVKVILPGVSSKPIIVVEGARVDRVVIKPVTQLPVINSKAIPWNYERVAIIVTFYDDELPVEGTEHNKALYLTLKCENSVVTRVLVENGSSTNICPLSTLSKLKIEEERIHKNSICVQGFDSGGRDSVGDIVLELTIGPVEFTMEFQVVKFEWDRQEIVVHGEDSLCAHNNAIVPVMEIKNDQGPWVYQGCNPDFYLAVCLKYANLVIFHHSMIQFSFHYHS